MRRPLRPLVLAALLTVGSGTALALTPTLGDLDTLPLHVAPAAVTAKALSELPQVKGQGPYVVAVNVALPLALDGGVWDQADDGRARWRTRVYSAGATSLLMAFDRFDLPPDAQLWIYDADGRAVQGPYTEANENADGTLWTPTVPGETAIVELRVPASLRPAVDLHLATLGHGFKNTRDLGGSGICNIDTVCPLGNGWRDEIRSAVKLQIPDGQFVVLCSGTLVNNLRQDGTPYVLTANHCGIGDFNSPASGVVTYWNFANTACNGADDASDAQNLTGAILRAGDERTDFTLLELSQTPPTSFDVHYAGWDASGTGGTSGVGIHHPVGDAKKISEYTTPLTADTVQIEFLGPNIPVWTVNGWNQGVTEVGSSGSGLWNQNRHLVGTLSGGSAACSGSGNNGQPDFYARLDSQWTANAAASGQLKAWLDPDNTDTRSVSGRDASLPNTPPQAQGDSFTVLSGSSGSEFNVLANDSDANGDNLTLDSLTAPSQGGTANIVSNQVRYTPAPGFVGIETFSYTISDGRGGSDTASVSISVQSTQADEDSSRAGAPNPVVLLMLGLLAGLRRRRPAAGPAAG